jgi:hypothetical protein
LISGIFVFAFIILLTTTFELTWPIKMARTSQTIVTKTTTDTHTNWY